MTSTEEVQRRIQFISELEEFVETCQRDMTQVLDTLDWSPDHFVQQKTSVVCPFNTHHIMSPESLLKHEPICNLASKGVPKDIAKSEEMQTSKFFYENVGSVGSYKLDCETLNKVLWNHHVQKHSIFYGKNKLPATSDEEAMTMTPDERGALYDYIVQQAREEGKMLGLEQDTLLTANLEELVKKKGLGGDNAKPKSYLEYLKTMRDYKRRRQSYRAKNVHITKKSYTEIIREVIENQTDYLTEILKDKDEIMEDQGDNTRQNTSVDDSRDQAGYKNCYRDSENRDCSTEPSSSRQRERSKSREREYDRQRDRRRYGSRDRKHSRSRDRKRSRSKEKNWGQSRERKHDGSRERRRNRSRERKRSQSRERRGLRSNERPHSQSRDERGRDERGSHNKGKDYYEIQAYRGDGEISDKGDSQVSGDVSDSKDKESCNDSSDGSHTSYRDRKRERNKHKKHKHKKKHKRYKSHDKSDDTDS